MSGGCKFRPISVKRNLQSEGDVAVSEHTVCCHVVAYEILRDCMYFILYFGMF